MKRGYKSISAARAAVGKTEARAIRHSVKLENVGGVLRYVPRFEPANEGQHEIVKRCGFECLDRGAQG